MIDLKLNGREVSLDVDPDTPLLWVIREQLGLAGTKYGCGIGACGACTVHLDGAAVRSCSLPVGAAIGAAITTIEGLSGDRSHPVQKAWIAGQVPQCGYCQSGMIMAAAALLAENPQPTDGEMTRRSPISVAAEPTSASAARSTRPRRPGRAADVFVSPTEFLARGG